MQASIWSSVLPKGLSVCTLASTCASILRSPAALALSAFSPSFSPIMILFIYQGYCVSTACLLMINWRTKAAWSWIRVIQPKRAPSERRPSSTWECHPMWQNSLMNISLQRKPRSLAFPAFVFQECCLEDSSWFRSPGPPQALRQCKASSPQGWELKQNPE